MTKRIAIADLEDETLAFAVAESVGQPVLIDDGCVHVNDPHSSDHGDIYSPFEDWSQCGPLIERYRMDFREVGGRIHASPGFSSGFWGGDPIAGGNHFIAACRAIVAAHNPSGFVEVPDELVEGE